MKIAYIGIDLLYPALPALAEAGCEIGEIFTCATDNVTEFNVKVYGFAREHRIPLSIGKMKMEDIFRARGRTGPALRRRITPFHGRRMPEKRIASCGLFMAMSVSTGRRTRLTALFAGRYAPCPNAAGMDFW